MHACSLINTLHISFQLERLNFLPGLQHIDAIGLCGMTRLQKALDRF